MPDTYDLGRKPPEGVLDMWMDRVAITVAARNITAIVDLGCGTGRFSELLARRFHANVIGVDPSTKMLAQAKAKPRSERVTFMSGTGERIPCADASADLIFASMAFHHFAAPIDVAKECVACCATAASSAYETARAGDLHPTNNTSRTMPAHSMRCRLLGTS